MAKIETKICKYVCIEKIVTSVSKFCTGKPVVTCEDVQVKMLPSDYEIGGMVKTCMMNKENIDPKTDRYCYKEATKHLRWYRKEHESYPTIANTLIDSCRMSGFFISSFGTDETKDGREILFYFFSNKEGNIDEENILQYDPSYEYTHQQIQNQIVPGELVHLYVWLSPESGELDEQWAGSVWWGTNYLSGGRIIAVNGEYGDEDITYTVDIMGKERAAVSSDFIEYAEGDWVYVSYLEAIGQNCEWEDDETGIPEDIEGATWVILPVKVWDYGA